MTTPWERSQKRLTDLLSDLAVFGLNAEEAVELRELLPDAWDGGFDLLGPDRGQVLLWQWESM